MPPAGGRTTTSPTWTVRTRGPVFPAGGTGDVDWTGDGSWLEKAEFEGWAILELDAADNPVEQMTAAREFVEELAATSG